jgi:hypothetical protein
MIRGELAGKQNGNIQNSTCVMMVTKETHAFLLDRKSPLLCHLVLQSFDASSKRVVPHVAVGDEVAARRTQETGGCVDYFVYFDGKLGQEIRVGQARVGQRGDGGNRVTARRDYSPAHEAWLAGGHLLREGKQRKATRIRSNLSES